jgi:nicotinate-nucleotide adenylyltransferase
MHGVENDDRLRRKDLRIAFFGGSFDPPHLGHLAVASAARDAFRLDTVLFAPVGTQPLKPEGSAAGFEDRVAMTRLAIEGEPGFDISLADAPKSAGENGSTASDTPSYTPNYTIDTLELLRASLAPDSSLYCLMGADSYFGLRRWHRAAELPFVASLIVASRPGQPREGFREALPPGLALESAPQRDRNESGIEVRAFYLINTAGNRAPLYLLPGLDVEISATEIRSSMYGSPGSATTLASPAAILPLPVAEYIRSHRLYS